MTGARFRYFVVDAFTNRPFQGNPAAVVPLDHWKEDSWLQSVSMEMNLSETAFLVPNSQGFDLRWFTPTTEVDLCGHATIASSVVLVHLGKLADGSEVAFSTRSGILGARRLSFIHNSIILSARRRARRWRSRSFCGGRSRVVAGRVGFRSCDCCSRPVESGVAESPRARAVSWGAASS